MRQVVLDTETTGLEVGKGHRIIEIGCVELNERRPTGRHFHRYLNPGRAIDDGAYAVHGIDIEFLADKPRFEDVVAEFLAFVDGAEVIAHNTIFDIGFIDSELARVDGSSGRLSDRCGILDTLALARETWPGQRNNLDALCKRLGVDNSQRSVHGALLDAQLLADVYLAMTAGQGDLGLAMQTSDNGIAGHRVVAAIPAVALLVRHADEAELAAHHTRLDRIAKAANGDSLWTRLGWDQASGR